MFKMSRNCLLIIALCQAVLTEDDLLYLFQSDTVEMRQPEMKYIHDPEHEVKLKTLEEQNSYDNLEDFKDMAEFHLFQSKWLKCINSSANQYDEINLSQMCSIIDMKYADCSGMNFSRVPSDLPTTLQTLILDNNGIRELYDDEFLKYSLLHSLSIASNCLCTLHGNAFNGLFQLKVLNLTNNILTFKSSTFPDEVFSPLLYLKVLKLNLNNPYIKYHNLSYPDKALSKLQRLESLHIDGLINNKFGEGFSNLTHLTTLKMAGYLTGNCYLFSLYNDTFNNLKHLEYLSIRDCNLIGNNIQSGSFEPLIKLKILAITHNENIGLENVDNILYGLRNAVHLHTLYLQLVNYRYSLGVCLNHRFVQHFPPNLKYLEVQENNLEAVDNLVIGKLPTSLKMLDISGNKFMLGEYLEDLHKLVNLSELRINGGKFDYNLPTYYPNISVSLSDVTKTCNNYNTRLIRSKRKNKLILQFPPNLKKIEMNEAGLSYKLTYFRVNPNNSLQTVSLRGNKFPVLFGPILGLNKLQHLDLSKCQIRNIFSSFFWNLTSLQQLNISWNYLPYVFKDQEKKDIFINLKNLQDLDISYTEIPLLTQGIMDHLISLKTLNLSSNPLKIFNVNISNMPELKSLRFKNTMLRSLDDSITAAVDNLIKQGSNITIDMSYCPILCECSNLKFIQWMKASPAFHREFRNYLCLYADGSGKLIDDQYETTLLILTHECASHTIIFFSVISTTTFTIVIIFLAIIYRFRWKLRYLYYAAYLHYWKYSKRQSPNETFDFDVFLCYHDDDEDFVLNTLNKELESRHLKTCVHKRDFVLGEPITTNIVRAVTSSRKTLVVLTPDMIKSKWCNFEVQMATMESVSIGRPVLIFLIMSKIHSNLMGNELSYCVENNTYVEFPDTQHTEDLVVMDNFWNKLANDINK